MELEDVATEQDNEAAGDAILNALWGEVEKPGVQIICKTRNLSIGLPGFSPGSIKPSVRARFVTCSMSTPRPSSSISMITVSASVEA